MEVYDGRFKRKNFFDKYLNIEVLTLLGRIEKLPNHFHNYYELGYIENGTRRVICQNKEYIIGANDLLLFNPNDNHACFEVENDILDFRCFHITTERMKELTLECLGYDVYPYFEPQIVYQSELVSQIKELIDLIQDPSCDNLQKEELLYLIIGDLVSGVAKSSECVRTGKSLMIERSCEYIENHYMDNISLSDLSVSAGVSKYHFIRMFTKEKGISPYRFIECVKITEAKKMLKEGLDLVDITYRLGFSSQSHFTNFFKKYTRITPSQYRRLYNS